jgi:hypothetical protein
MPDLRPWFGWYTYVAGKVDSHSLSEFTKLAHKAALHACVM